MHSTLRAEFVLPSSPWLQCSQANRKLPVNDPLIKSTERMLEEWLSGISCSFNLIFNFSNSRIININGGTQPFYTRLRARHDTHPLNPRQPPFLRALVFVSGNRKSPTECLVRLGTPSNSSLLNSTEGIYCDDFHAEDDSTTPHPWVPQGAGDSNSDKQEAGGQRALGFDASSVKSVIRSRLQ